MTSRSLAVLLAVLLFSFSSARAHADPLSDLRASLQKLAGEQPVKAQIVVKNTVKNHDEDQAQQRVEEGTVVAEDGPQGLRLSWAPQQIHEARKAEWQKAANPDAPVQHGSSLSVLGAKDAADLLDYAEPLRLLLEGAALVDNKVEPRNGKAGRLLVLRPRDGLTASDKKSLKDREDVLKVWLDETGLPVTLDRSVKLKFSKFFISFAVTVHEARTFTRLGDRLLVTQWNEESSGAGMGQGGESRKVIRVTPMP
ncbi:MAG TPA: hypothetical protein VF173_22690 [Thermoanaerobaculia bacterium]|nr:hypothetical protein [Thermoanaerobaculia bacterium]